MNTSRAPVRERAAVLRRRAAASRPGRIAQEARADDLGVHLLAITAQQLLCVVPLAVALAAVARRVADVAITDVLTHVLALDHGAHDLLQRSFGDSVHVGLAALWTNFAIAMVFGIGFAASVQRGLETMWRLPRAAARGSLVRQTGWTLALPVVVSSVVALGRGTHEGGSAVSACGLAGQVMIVASFVWWTQRVLLVRRVAGATLAVAAGLSTLALAAVLLVARWLVSGQLDAAAHAYGTVGVFVVLSAWIGAASTATIGALAIAALRYRTAAHRLRERATPNGR